MPTPWIDSVRSTGQLEVYIDNALGTGWRQVVSDAIRSFNTIATRDRLGVQFTVVTTAPGNTAGAGADVAVRTINGSGSFRFEGTDYPVNLAGSGMHGLTMQVKYASPLRVAKAFVYLPLNPLGNTPRGQRPAGTGVRLVIAFHELVHACGLSNDDHGSAAFHGTPSFDYGRTAADDRIVVGSGRKRIVMPPLVLSGETRRLIRDNWS
jgi:hypothetical protein